MEQKDESSWEKIHNFSEIKSLAELRNKFPDFGFKQEAFSTIYNIDSYIKDSNVGIAYTCSCAGKGNVIAAIPTFKHRANHTSVNCKNCGNLLYFLGID